MIAVEIARESLQKAFPNTTWQGDDALLTASLGDILLGVSCRHGKVEIAKGHCGSSFPGLQFSSLQELERALSVLRTYLLGVAGSVIHALGEMPEGQPIAAFRTQHEIENALDYLLEQKEAEDDPLAALFG